LIRYKRSEFDFAKYTYARKWDVDIGFWSAFRREEKSTTRRAWDEVRDYTVREIQSREAMVGALKEDIVKELVRLKVGVLILRPYSTERSVSGRANEDTDGVEG
jgi:hypothetical protein